MGIPGLYGNWLSKRVKRAIVRGVPGDVSSVSFDLNGIFHDARRIVMLDDAKDKKSRDRLAAKGREAIEREIIEEITTIVSDLTSTFRPRDLLILAVDGVAPGAKLQQQKARREKAAKDMSPLDLFDRNAFTPGTDLMMRIDDRLRTFVEENVGKLAPKIIYSSHLVPGEGEHKIMSYLKTVADRSETHVIYGLDADLIMLSLLLPIRDVFLTRNSDFSTIDIREVREYLTDIAGKKTVTDFVIMTMLLGNDFLPKSPSMQDMHHSIDLLLQTYSKGKYWLHGLDENDRLSVNFSDLRLFLREFAKNEDALFKRSAQMTVPFPSRFIQGGTVKGSIYPKKIRELWYTNEFGRVNGGDVWDMCRDYFTTVAWVFLYYTGGTEEVNQEWSYKYYHAPLLSDLAANCDACPILLYDTFPGMIRFTALHQLISVLPLKSKVLLPKELQPMMEDSSPIRDIYPQDFTVELDGALYAHEGVAIVPFVDMNRIFEVVSTIVFKEETVAKYLPKEDLVLTR